MNLRREALQLALVILLYVAGMLALAAYCWSIAMGVPR